MISPFGVEHGYPGSVSKMAPKKPYPFGLGGNPLARGIKAASKKNRTIDPSKKKITPGDGAVSPFGPIRRKPKQK